ncbi:MAG: D-alanine--D-alanine ligase family protein [Simkaniaceae bacterium]
MTLRLGLIYGGNSPEHDISFRSFQSIQEMMNREKYLLIPIKIEREGHFDINLLHEIDLAFPILHGPNGEDGTIQGMLKLLNIPIVGPPHSFCTIAMDKDLTKRLLSFSHLPTANWITLKSRSDYAFEEVVEKLSLPFFVKPAHMGSSLGVSKVYSKAAFEEALKKAFEIDSKVIIEEEIKGREIECGILGSKNPKASCLGEIILPKDSYYSYELKYVSSERVQFAIPAKIDSSLTEAIRSAALKAYDVLGGAGMARIDFLVKESGEFYINEVNPIPGFTSISLYPKMWKESGLGFQSLLEELISSSQIRKNREGRTQHVAELL